MPLCSLTCSASELERPRRRNLESARRSLNPSRRAREHTTEEGEEETRTTLPSRPDSCPIPSSIPIPLLDPPTTSPTLALPLPIPIPPVPPPAPTRYSSSRSTSTRRSTSSSPRSSKGSFSSLLRTTTSLLFGSHSHSDTTIPTSTSRSKGMHGCGAAGDEGRPEERGEEPVVDQQLREAEEEEVLAEDQSHFETRMRWREGSSWNWRHSPRREQMIETAECDEYVRMVQWENGW